MECSAVSSLDAMRGTSYLVQSVLGQRSKKLHIGGWVADEGCWRRQEEEVELLRFFRQVRGHLSGMAE
jgi:hypothetical protein